MSNQAIREQVFDVLFNYIKRADGIYTESDCATVRDEISLLIDQSNFTADEAEGFINQEVEKRIKERMPSEEEIIDQTDDYGQRHLEDESGRCIYGITTNAFRQGVKWLRSRLTCSEKPNNSQMTEGGAK